MSASSRHPSHSGLVQNLTPVRTAFFGSILLSLIALQKGVINRDGMLYVDTARVFIDHGFNAALEVFPWPFMSILMAILSQITGLDIETTGHVLNVLFMAGACGLLVAAASRLFPEAIWPICLVVLSIPAFNEYRDELIREYGTWFFLMLAIWLALRWSENPSWGIGLAINLSLVCAALFRPEAIAYILPLALWQITRPYAVNRWRGMLMLGLLPSIGFILLVGLYASGLLSSQRLLAEISRFQLHSFDDKVNALAGALIPYARDQATTILILGSFGLIPLKFVAKMGLFSIPLGYAFSRHSVKELLSRNSLFAWLFLTHALILSVFVLDLQFLAGRYIALLLVFVAPLTGYGLWLLIKRHHAFKFVMIVLALMFMLGNVVSLSPTKQQFVEAGSWLSSNVKESPRVYAGSPRSSYYAGWHYRHGTLSLSQIKDQLKTEVAQGKYDLLIIEASDKDCNVTACLQEIGVREVRRFSRGNGPIVLIAVPEVEMPHQAKP